MTRPAKSEAAMKNWKAVKTDKKMVLGRYIVADPKVCGGRLTFRGTRVYVADVLQQAATGIDWEFIREALGKEVRLEAIAEALRLAREALLTYWLPPENEWPREGDEAWDEDDDHGVHWWQRYRTVRKMVFGRHVVADPKICHGKLTFRGTRVFVADVLDQVAEGRSWKGIGESWNKSVGPKAITEALLLAREALLTHWPNMEIKDAVSDARAG